MILTILNSLAIIYLIAKANGIYLTVEKEQTSNGTTTGYRGYVMKKTEYGSRSIYSVGIPIRNSNKTELSEEISKLMSMNHLGNRDYTLRAKFSWLRTRKEVEDFERNYKVVNEELVKELVGSFMENQPKE